MFYICIVQHRIALITWRSWGIKATIFFSVSQNVPTRPEVATAVWIVAVFASLTRNLTNLTKRWSQIHKGCQCQLRQFTSRSHILHIPSVIKRGNGKSCIYNRYIIVDFPTKTSIDRGFSSPPRLTTGGDSDYIMCVQKVNLTRDGKWIHSNDKKSKGITISLSRTWQLFFFHEEIIYKCRCKGWMFMIVDGFPDFHCHCSLKFWNY
jgi:hypothetical protein